MPPKSLTALLLAMAPVLALAPVAGASPAWNEGAALALFLARSPQVAAARQGPATARAAVLAAGVWANPTLDVGREQVFSAGGPAEQNRIGLQAGLPLTGRRELARAVADAGVALAEAEAAQRVAGLAQAFRGAYAAAHFGAAQAGALAQGLTTYGRLERVVEARRRSGEAAGYDAIRLGLERAALEAQRDELAARMAGARSQLTALLGQPLDGALTLATAPPVAPIPPVEGLLTQALAGRPDLLAVRAGLAQARLQGQLADRLRWPEPALSFGLKQTNEPTVQGFGYAAGLSWPLPVFDSGQAGLARADAERARWRAEEAATLARIRIEVPAARAALLARVATATRFRRSVLAGLPRMLTVAELAYREGEAGIVPLLDAHRAAQQARAQAIDLDAAAHAATLDLERLIGAPLPTR